MRRACVLLTLLACAAGCAGGHHRETAADVAQRLGNTSTGPLANPARVTCHRASAKWWACEVSLQQRGGFGTSTVELRVPVR